jgi:hypothetical protein
MNPKLEVEQIERALAALLAEYPELVEDEDLRAGMVEGSTDAMDVLARIVAQAMEARIHADGCGLMIDSLRKRAARLDRREDALRALAMRIMAAAGLTKAELACATVSIRAGTPKVVATDEDAIPDHFWRVKRELDKARLKEALKAGFVPGAELSNAEPVLTMRIA